MTRANKLSKIFVILLFVAVAATLTFAFVNVPTRVANAEGADLNSCTADYKIIEEESSLWYQSNGSWRLGPKPKQDDATGDQRTILVQITTAGEFVCGWGIGRQQEKPDEKLNFNTAPVKDVQFQLLVYKYSDKGNKGNPVLSNRTGGPTSASSPSLKQTEEFRQKVEVGDYIEFRFENYSYNYGTECYLFFKAPQNKAHILASVADDCTAGGNIKSDSSTENPGQDVKTDTYDVVWGETFALTATAAEGYTFSHWSDEEGVTVGGATTYTTTVLGENNNKHYYAHFVKNDVTGVAVYSSKSGENTQWTESDVDGGKRYVMDRTHWTTVGDIAAIKLDFFAPSEGVYLVFDYLDNTIHTSASLKAGEWTGKAKVSVLRTFQKYKANPEEKELTRGVIFFNEGFHHVELYCEYPSTSPPYVPSDTDTVIIENLRLSALNDLERSKIDLKIDEEYNLQVKYEGLTEPQTLSSSNTEVMIPIGLSGIEFKAVCVNATKPSAIDPESQVKVSFMGFFGNFTKDDVSWEQTSDTFYLTNYSDRKIGIGSRSTASPTLYTPADGGMAPKIEVKHKEQAPEFKVSAEKTENGVQSSIEQIEKGQNIQFPFNKTNSLTLSIKKYLGLTGENYKLIVSEVDCSLQLQDMGGYFIFPINDVRGSDIEIFYSHEDDQIVYSDIDFTFHVEEIMEGDIDIVNRTASETTGSVTIANDSSNKWLFDPFGSEEDNFAFGLRIRSKYDAQSECYWGVETLSNLTFTMTGAETGSLSLQFRLEGYYEGADLGGSATRSGQLWWRNGTKFNTGDLTKVGHPSGDSWVETLDNATWLGRPKTIKDGGMEYANGVIEVGDGWYQVNIPIQQDIPLYLGFLVPGKPHTGTPNYHECSAAIRDVRLITGNKNVTLKISQEASADSSATATVSDEEHEATTNGVPMTVTAGALVQLSATIGVEDQFYGWSVGGVLVSTEETANVYVNDDSEIVAWIAPKKSYIARANGTFYTSVKKAADGASSGQTIYLLEDETTVDESFEIKKGVTLLLPFDGTNRLTEMGSDSTAQNKIAWLGTTYNDAYRTLTLKNGVTITVNGTLAVGGVMSIPGSTVYQGHTSGHYSEIILESGSKIEVKEGGVFDVYGRVWGGEGRTSANMGTIDVAKGGKVYEPFLILDFAGGSNTLGFYLAGQTPFKRYAMINIEVPMTINYGGALVGHASLYAINQFFSLDQTFIGDDSVLQTEGGIETFVMLSGENSKVTITYDASRALLSGKGGNVDDCTEGIGLIKMVFEGGAKFSYMMFSAMGITVPTNPVYFSIPYNYEVEMNGQDAQYETRTDFKIMPGAKVTVGEGATLTLNANAYVYDGLVLPVLPSTKKMSYPTAENLEAAGYSRNGNLIVNGTLKIGIKTRVEGMDLGSILGGGPSDFEPGTDPATFLGLIQTNGSGRIEIPAGSTLKGTIVDGGAGNAHYFEYTTTARVWDAAHSCFADLQDGHNYTATGDATFNLENLFYATTEHGEQDQELDLSKQQLQGSWKVDHEEHNFNWTPNAKEYADLNDGNTHKPLTRQCTELGCTHIEQKELLYVVASLGGIDYDGDKISEEDIKALFIALYGDGVKISSISFDSGITNAGQNYEATIALDGALWLVEGTYVDSHTLKFNVNAKKITVTAQNQESVYDGNVVTPAQDKFDAPELCPNDSLMLTIQAKDGREIKDQGVYELEIVMGVGGSNANYEITLAGGTYTVKHREITVTIGSASSAEGDMLVDVSHIGYTVTSDMGFVNDDKATFDGYIDSYECNVADAKANNSYPITMKFNSGVTTESLKNGQTMTNYKITVVDGRYSITDSIFKDVTFESKEDIVYNKQNHKIEVQNAPMGAEIIYTYHDATSDDFKPFPAEGVSAAGTYTIKVEITLAGHTNKYIGQATLKIAQENITVQINKQSKDYDTHDGAPTYEQGNDKDWYVTSGTVYPGDDLGVTLSLTGGSTYNQAAKYNIKGEWTNPNYKVTFNGGDNAYEITKALLTVTALPQQSFYGDTPVSVTNIQNKDDFYTIVGWLENAPLDVTLSHNVTMQSGYLEQGYDIVVTVTPGQANLNNYNVQTVNGKYTVQKRNITVIIANQDDVYNFENQYKWDPNAWEIDVKTPLVNNEERSVLNVELNTPELVGAGKYPITATYSSDNYKVTFEGEWTENDENKDVAGVFTIARKLLTHDGREVIINLVIGEDEKEDAERSVRYNGTPIALSASIWVQEGATLRPITAYELSESTLSVTGKRSIVVTITDANYTGSRTFEVEVLTAEGYSQTLDDALKALKGIVGDLKYYTLTSSEEHFNIVKQVKEKLDALSEEDKRAGAAELAQYEQLVETWTNAANIDDDIIETAKELADSPIKWLFVLAEVSALIAAMFVIGKGGLML